MISSLAWMRLKKKKVALERKTMSVELQKIELFSYSRNWFELSLLLFHKICQAENVP